MIEEHKILFDYDKKALKEKYAQHVHCPVCGENDPALLYEKDWFRYCRCKKCSMVYLNPRLNIAATHQFYNSAANAIYNGLKFKQESSANEYDNQENLKNLEAIDRYRNSTLKGDLLEIGSAKGYFLEKARDAGYNVHGVELNEENWRYSREKLGKTMLNVDLLEANYPSEMFDVIYMRDLIQHIPNLKEFLVECRRIARPGCVIYIGTHNIDGLIARFAKSKYTPIFGFMEPNHFSVKTLSRVLEETGFAVRDVRFQSADFTLGHIISYCGEPPFTTVFPPKIGRLRRRTVKLLELLFFKTPLRYLDSFIMPPIANALKRGSWMNVLAVKE